MGAGATARLPLKDVVAYILTKHGCMHPFRISRILVLANWKALEKLGEPLTAFTVEGFEAGFSIPEVDALKNSQCFRVDKERKCLTYTCEEPKLPREAAEILDEVIAETKDLDIVALNRLVVRDPRYRKLLQEGGFK